ncbi:MAG: hypothetical protein OZSIB_3598 [Candidatus Ozemobacter sibiricus]|uniref:CULT domain-containing protein n=1 Tax=Candidatus Ozemobacter sibiricus TaxID=2268124 RepID=A0A367ZPM7_9BACT|nr:MAG: hypothetical protein OZSIB_3598 [Candidatus Ozemobacter sibiricus]
MRTAARVRQDEGRAAPRPIVCAACRHPVTSTAERCEMAGHHRHVFTNPAGFVFEIGCFRQAPGCRALGQPTTEYTWFPGWAWQIAVCRGCGEHLGWAYSTGTFARFHGLILERLHELADASDPANPAG